MIEQMSPVEGLLLRAGMYEMLAVGYAYPDAAQHERLQRLVTDLSPWVSLIHPDWAKRLNGLQASAQADPSEQEADFNRLFSGGMAVAPFETAYEPDIFRKQHTMADIAGFYRAFGFEVTPESRWQPDHLGVELEYAAILLERTANALEQGWDEQVEVCIDALRKFLADHIGRWSAAFAEDLTKVAQAPFYRHMAEATREWLEAELQALGLEPDRLRSRQVFADDLELPACGGCTGCGPTGPTGGPCPTSKM